MNERLALKEKNGVVRKSGIQELDWRRKRGLNTKNVLILLGTLLHLVKYANEHIHSRGVSMYVLRTRECSKRTWSLVREPTGGGHQH